MQATVRTQDAAAIGERDELYHAMRSRSTQLDAQVMQCITHRWQGTSCTLLQVERLGHWYLGMQHYGWMQCAVFRIYYIDAAGEQRSRLREYGILTQGGPPQIMVLDA